MWSSSCGQGSSFEDLKCAKKQNYFILLCNKEVLNKADPYPMSRPNYLQITC